ncbi:phage tail protein [Pelagibacterium lacus]|uniref:Tip attachment protein J domain-containing protein n=1 Tax=Pelagibacterium lacus TaxID=2282655 RepID=A0A369W1M2_9HYPH|nr:phage tail protein [Pelagibacterium lacus]RDE08438.1 hypothetical protein DVH29_11245 [Pelagibacterium lacus]
MPFLVAPIAGLFGGGIVAQLLVGTALYVGGTLLAQALAPKQKDPGVSLTMQIGGDSPLSFFVGTAATAGHRVYAGAWGNEGQTPNAYFVDVLELANAPLDGLSNVYVNGELATIRWSDPHPDYGYPINQGRKGGRDHLWVKFHDGRQTVADPYLVSKFSGSERPYGADRIGLGNAYAVVTVRYNRELWKSGAPKMLFEVRGLRLYDIRKDSSAGGIGTHRRNNPATWEWTDNPYVIAYNVAFMGVYVGSEWLWGLQNLPALRLPTSAWVAAMNEADRRLAAWDNQKQFTIGGEITVDMEPAAVLEEIAKSSLGRFIESAGSYKPRCGAPGTSVYSFGEADLLITDPRTVTPFPGLEATHNTVEASYTEPGEAWGWKPAPVQSSAAYIAADGNRTLSAGLRFPMVSRNEQVQRLAYSYLEDGRRFRQFRASFHPITWLLEPGDVIDGTILSEGYSGKQFEILEMSGRRSFVQTMTLREIDPADFDPPAAARQEWSVGTIQTIYPPAQVVTGWAVSPYAHTDSESRARRPGIQCFYQGGMDDIRDIKIMIRRSGEVEPFFSQPYPYDADNLTPSVIIVGELILGNEPYEVASIFVPFSPRDMDMSDWLAVTTPDIRVSEGDLSSELQDLLGDTRQFLDVDLGEILGEIGDIDETLSIVEAQVADLLSTPAYDPELAYTDGQMVTFDGGLYVAIQDAPIGVTPANAAYWQKVGDYESLGEAVAAIGSTLNSEVFRIDGVLEAQSTAITSLGTVIEGKADAAALNSLSLTVSEQGDDIVSQGQAITGLSNALADKADASAVQSLATTVSDQGDAIEAQGTAITGVQSALGGKADASALSSLATTVSDQGDTIEAQGLAITEVQSDLADKADASALSGLSATVSQQGDDLTAVSEGFQDLSALVDDVESSVAVVAKAEASPGGGVSQFAVQVKIDGPNTFSPGIFTIRATPTMSEALFGVDRFSIVDSLGNVLGVFASDGQLQYARIPIIQADKIDAASIFAVNANITGTLQVGTGATGVFLQGPNNRILIVDGT